MHKKILFTDLDGTLLNDRKEITPGCQAAIDETLERGHIIVLSTGRPLASALILARRLNLIREGCFAFAFNGAQIYDLYHEKTIYGKGLPLKVIPPIFRAAAKMRLHIQTYDDESIFSEHETDALKTYSAIHGLPVRIVPDIGAALKQSPYKLLAIDYQDHEKLLRFQEEILPGYANLLDSFFSDDCLLEMVPVGISKGFAVRWLCEYLAVPLEYSVAAGDAQNDIPMLQAAHVGAVMRNAFPGVAGYGDYITQADNNNDGVAEIIRRFILSD